MRIPLTVDQSETDRLSRSRQCGKCTACCVLPRILPSEDTEGSILPGGKEGYTPCQHLGCAGCSRYDERPDVCRGFMCLWRMGYIQGDERRRPDNLGLMFTFEVVGTKYAIEAWELWEGAASDHPGRGVIDAVVARHPGMPLAIRYYGVLASLEYRGPSSLVTGRMLSQWATREPAKLASYLRLLIARGYLEVPQVSRDHVLHEMDRLARGGAVPAHFGRPQEVK